MSENETPNKVYASAFWTLLGPVYTVLYSVIWSGIVFANSYALYHFLFLWQGGSFVYFGVVLVVFFLWGLFMNFRSTYQSWVKVNLGTDEVAGHTIFLISRRVKFESIRKIIEDQIFYDQDGQSRYVRIGHISNFGEMMEEILPNCINCHRIELENVLVQSSWQKTPNWEVVNVAQRKAKERAVHSPRQP